MGSSTNPNTCVLCAGPLSATYHNGQHGSWVTWFCPMCDVQRTPTPTPPAPADDARARVDEAHRALGKPGRVDDDGCCTGCGRSVQPSPCCPDFPVWPGPCRSCYADDAIGAEAAAWALKSPMGRLYRKTFPTWEDAEGAAQSIHDRDGEGARPTVVPIYALPLSARDDAVEEAMAPGCHEHVALWDAINAYSAACGGHPTRGGGARMDAVVRVEKALRAALRREKGGGK